jgi:hypothetical protein
MSYGSLGENNINCIREEWRARQRLVDTEGAEAELIDDDNDDDDEDVTKRDRQSSSSNKNPPVAPPQWKLQDILEEKENTKTSKSTSTTEDSTTASASATGLRQRKMNNTNNIDNDQEVDTTETEWTMVQEETEDDDDDGTMMLLKRDPIEFLGGWMPPRELKIAQQKSKRALQTYVEAANAAARLLSIVHSLEGKNEEDK